jgi:hypothetical protein
MWCHIDEPRGDDVFDQRLAPAILVPLEQLR